MLLYSVGGVTLWLMTNGQCPSEKIDTLREWAMLVVTLVVLTPFIGLFVILAAVWWGAAMFLLFSYAKQALEDLF